jgi:hypothetical protein
MDCPGETCGICSESCSHHKDEGYVFVSHTVNGPLPQLTFLAGLAALCDKYRKEMEK